MISLNILYVMYSHVSPMPGATRPQKGKIDSVKISRGFQRVYH